MLPVHFLLPQHPANHIPRAQPKPHTHQFLACSGSTSTDVLETQIPALDDNLDLLTSSAGGNYISLTPILSNCIYQFYLLGEDACQTGEMGGWVEEL